MKLNSIYILAVIGIAAFFPAAYGLSPEVLAISAAVVLCSAVFVERGVSVKRSAFGQLGEVGEAKKEYESKLSPEMAEAVKAVGDIKDDISKKYTELKGYVEKSVEEIQATGKLSEAAKANVDEVQGQYQKLVDQVQALEQKHFKAANDQPEQAKSFGKQFIESEQFKAMVDTSGKSCQVEYKAAIINATGQNQPLVPSDRLTGVYTDPNRVLTVRDALGAAVPTGSNLIEFVRENVFTNNAGPQVGGSPQQFENVAKPESSVTFTLENTPVQTLAHFIPASKQVLSDSPMLMSFIDRRLMYGLKLEEEDQLLNGSGANGNLNGLITQATAYSPSSPNITNQVDLIRHAILQAWLSEYRPDYILLNHADWYDIETKKVGSSDDRYVVGNPREYTAPRLWGLPIIPTNSIAAGKFLLGNFAMGADIYDREQATIEVSREHSDNFTKNMVTILAEERIALVVYRTQAFITGSL